MTPEEYTLAVEIVKSFLVPGYLYGVKDGELYCIEAEIPEPGQTLHMNMRMPQEDEQ